MKLKVLLHHFSSILIKIERFPTNGHSVAQSHRNNIEKLIWLQNLSNYEQANVNGQ